MDRSSCSLHWPLEGDQLCALSPLQPGDSCYRDSCQGDSGGALGHFHTTQIAALQVIECNDVEGVRSVGCGQCCSVASRFGMRTLVGIVSFGESECGGVADPRPGVYTNIAAHTSWIKDVMAGVE